QIQVEHARETVRCEQGNSGARGPSIPTLRLAPPEAELIAPDDLQHARPLPRSQN
ncbi:unnamed protein product, partial [Peniophora sp. CBMAI 1063]